jgi:membrane protein DedA with SNARE-associated domain
MADIPQLLANYDALVGVALGAGLTYGFGSLNRRHQEAREDKTRWYQARLEAYTKFYRALSDWWILTARDQATRPTTRSS